MLWTCNDCTTPYSVDAPRCPQCGSSDYAEQGESQSAVVQGSTGNALVPRDVTVQAGVAQGTGATRK